MIFAVRFDACARFVYVCLQQISSICFCLRAVLSPVFLSFSLSIYVLNTKRDAAKRHHLATRSRSCGAWPTAKIAWSVAYAFIQKHLANCFIFHISLSNWRVWCVSVANSNDGCCGNASVFCSLPLRQRSDASRSRRLNVCLWRGSAILWQDGSYAWLMWTNICTRAKFKLNLRDLRVKEKGRKSMKLDADTAGHCFILYYGNMSHECVRISLLLSPIHWPIFIFICFCTAITEHIHLPLTGIRPNFLFFLVYEWEKLKGECHTFSGTHHFFSTSLFKRLVWRSKCHR